MMSVQGPQDPGILLISLKSSRNLGPGADQPTISNVVDAIFFRPGDRHVSRQGRRDRARRARVLGNSGERPTTRPSPLLAGQAGRRSAILPRANAGWAMDAAIGAFLPPQKSDHPETSIANIQTRPAPIRPCQGALQ